MLKSLQIKSLLALTIFFITLTSFSPAHKYPKKVDTAYRSSAAFLPMSFSTARQKARAEGKILMIDFMASWCGPCRWMDETTFSNDDVIAALKSDFVAVKVDIDDFDGSTVAKKYNIKMLPTLVFINANGKVITRYEETFGPTKMLQILDELKAVDANGGSFTTPKEDKKNSEANKGGNKSNTKPMDAPVVKPPIVKKENGNLSKVLYAKSAEIAKKGFGIQVGFYSNVDNAIRESDRLKPVYSDQEVNIVVCDWQDNKKAYRVLLGNFSSAIQASKLYERYKTEQQSNPGQVKKYSDL
ncbi:MAG: thioredoxin family protein [Saprospiraceae bacterium]|nr:thioredoxin family protein [Saprospiraceae bacterium]